MTTVQRWTVKGVNQQYRFIAYSAELCECIRCNESNHSIQNPVYGHYYMWQYIENEI
jgi:hypothetical protein